LGKKASVAGCACACSTIGEKNKGNCIVSGVAVRGC
jgi:hypothetical protein